MGDPYARLIRVVVRLNRKFQAPREKVFQAWTDPETLKKWWCPAGWTPAEMEVDLRVGGAFRIGMRRASVARPPVYVSGHFLEVQFPAKLVYTWRWDGAFEQMPETRVNLEFLEAGAGTQVLLIHENFPDIPLRQQHRAGWIAACDRIERIL